MDIKDLKKPAEDFPGVAIDEADNCKKTSCDVSEDSVEEDVKDLNNNPRNTDDVMP